MSSLQSFFSTHDLRGYPVKVAVYVPSVTSSKKATVTQEQLIRVTRNFLVKRVGGCTELAAQGYYEDIENKTVVRERVSYFYAFTSVATARKYAPQLKQLANLICIEFEQSEVAIEVDGVLHSYKPTDKYRDEYLRRASAAKAKGAESVFQQLLNELKLDGED